MKQDAVEKRESSRKTGSRRGRFLKWIALGLGGLVVLVLFLIFALVPLFGGSIVSGQVNKRIAGEIGVERIWINPFRFRVSVQGVGLRAPDGGDVLAVERLSANVDPVGSLIAGELRAQAFVLDGARIDLVVDEGGELSLLEAVAMETALESNPEPETAGQAEPQAIPQAWLGLLAVSNVVIHFEDRSRNPVFGKTIDPIAFRMENLRTGPEGASQLLFSAMTTAEESIRIDGTFQMEPLAISGELDVSGVRLSDYSAFVEQAAPAVIRDGRVRVQAGYALTMDDSGMAAQLRNGEVTLEQLLVEMSGQRAATARLEELRLGGITVDLGLPADGDMTVSARVDCRLTRFAAQLDGDDQPFASFSELLVDAIEYDMMPMDLRIPEVTLVDPVVMADRDAAGQFNVMALTGGPSEAPAAPPATHAETAATASKSAPEFGLQIGKVSLVNGEARFRDASVSPAADLQVHPLNVTVAPVTLDAGTASRVEVSAIIEEAGELLLESEFHLMDPSKQTTAALDIQGIPLASFSPYSAQFTGKPIEAGTFKAAFDYAIADNELEAGNVLTVGQIRFGETVPGYTGKTYPMGTAVAVLENSRGEIVLDVPLRGSLDDPSFQPATIVINTLTGLFFKAITAPLNIAGKLGGSVISGVVGIAGGGAEEAGADYSRVSFGIGTESVSGKDGATVLPVVADMLNNRPRLRLSVHASVDPEKDVAALQTALLESKLAEMPGETRAETIRQAYRLLIRGEGPEPVAEPEAAEGAGDSRQAERDVAASPDSAVATEALPAKPMPGFYLQAKRGGEGRPVEESFYTRGSGRSLPLREVVRVEPEEPPSDAEKTAMGETATASSGETVGSGLPSIGTMEQELKERLYSEAALADLARSRAETVVGILQTEYGVDAERLEVQESFQRNGAAVLFSVNRHAAEESSL